MLKKIMPAVMAMFLCAAVSHAEESITIQILHKSFPNVKAEKAGKSVIPGLYEVEAGNNVFYFEPRNGYLIFGDIITKEGKNLTAEKRQELLARRVKEIPLEKGIKIGDGKSVVIEFTDPDCPFCRKAADWLEKNREGVTRYVFLYPITRLHPGADAKAKYILGAKDQEKAYHEVMSGALDSIDAGKLKLTEKAGALLEEHKQIAMKAGVFATPTLWVNGKHVPGADIPLIEKYLKGEK